MEPQEDVTIGVIQVKLEPDTQDEKTRDELLHLFIYIVTQLCGKDEREDTPDSAGYFIAMLHRYYKATPEQREGIRETLLKNGLQHGVDNRMIVIYKNATRTKVPVPDSDGFKIQGGMPTFNDIIGFVGYYQGGPLNPLVHIGYVFVAEAYRNQGICRHVLRTFLESVSKDIGLDLPSLFTSDVIAMDKPLRLFLSCGFEFSRIPVRDSLLSVKSGRALGLELRSDIKVNGTGACLNPKYHVLVDPVETTFRMVYMPWQCHQCFKKPESLHDCAKCHSVRYCSTECQKKAWVLHKSYCNDTRL